MTVDGETFREDLILLPGRVIPGWRRKEGHSLGEEDLEKVFDFGPKILVVGTGAHGVMKVPAHLRNLLASEGIDLIADRTEAAARRFNELLREGRRVAGCFHLTC
jgi:hypothetical protein